MYRTFYIFQKCDTPGKRFLDKIPQLENRYLPQHETSLKKQFLLTLSKLLIKQINLITDYFHCQDYNAEILLFLRELVSERVATILHRNGTPGTAIRYGATLS